MFWWFFKKLKFIEVVFCILKKKYIIKFDGLKENLSFELDRVLVMKNEVWLFVWNG